ncbi:site-specific integrase [Delftia sp. JD2]|uniref:tyrosine-type recombinase/integrase n=1 Tax=Delftia sp. JD2 TaxID=469553 RepID=UPI000A0708FB|nr:site-specific integrase [Delftia sp. JD2]
MSTRKLTIGTSPAPSRRPRLPSGISYHPTPQGLKYRIRIRSEKKLRALGATEQIDEVFDELKQAEQRLIKLKYKKDEVQQEFIKKFIDEVSLITIAELLEEHYTQYYSKLKSSKEHKSRMNVISRTLILAEDPRIIKIATIKFRTTQAVDNKIEFGSVPVVEFSKYLNSFIFSRKQKVKNQTIVNDLMFLLTALKNAHNYFSNIEKIKDPLETVDFKQLKDQVTYRNKRLNPQTRAAIETILLEKSRKLHYWEMFVFLSETGMRISEALSVLKKDVDTSKDIISLISKKNDKPRFVGVTEKLKEILYKKIENLKATDRVFPFSKETFQTKLKNIRPHLDELGIRFHWHMLRHTFISNGFESKSIPNLMNEVDINDFQHFQQQYLNPHQSEQIAIKVAKAQQLTPYEMQVVAGHGSPEVTIGTYTHQRELTKEEILIKQNEELKIMLMQLTKKIAEKD